MTEDEPGAEDVLPAKPGARVLGPKDPCPCLSQRPLHKATFAAPALPEGIWVIPGTAPFAQHGCTNWMMEQYLESLTFTLRILKVFHILQQRRAV